ncbi:MAG: hypothetical protein KAS53_03445 [Candidatus Cloacimonetes bacterium]|nr:hypothetical protein [Candidatus Cloacimonadota bacterium]
MREKLFIKGSEFIRQGSTWHHNLVNELVELKIILGAEGTKKKLVEELAKYYTGSLPKGSYLLRLVSVVEKLQKKDVPKELYEKIPLSYWIKLIKYVTRDNAQEIIDCLNNEVQLKILIEKLKQGFELRYNLFSGEHEFYREKKKDENP